MFTETNMIASPQENVHMSEVYSYYTARIYSSQEVYIKTDSKAETSGLYSFVHITSLTAAKSNNNSTSEPCEKGHLI